ncbi:MAG: hypothetical protein J6T28_09085 [Paludibacteraceae bacterium]|nr:hypothetical protein [Paludibacteraceae bacterium]MBO7607750.1 hypothetical protein [Paludibacteraceae bacterium]
MANTCSTTYICVGDPKEVSELHQLLEANGDTTIYSLLESMGVDFDYLDKRGLRTRGTITYFDYDGEGKLTIDQDTAWCEQEGFRISIEKKYPSIKVYYREEEPGCDVFFTNDMTGDYFPERFLLDSDDVYEYFSNAKDACDYLRDKFGINASGETEEEIQAAIDEYAEEQGEDFWMNIHEFKYVED